MTKLGFTLTFLTVVCLLFLSGCDCCKDGAAEAKAELAAVIKDRDKLQEQVSELTKERDAAVAKARTAQTTIKDLMNQLTEQMEEVSELQDLNEELQATIDGLQ